MRVWWCSYPTSTGGSMSHGNARLTPAGRLLLVRRVAAGEPQAEVARQMRLSRGTVAKWWGRWVEFGDAGLVDRSSRPLRSPRRTDAATEERICRLRRSTMRGPAYLSARTGVPASTVWRVLRRHGLNRLDRLDRPTGRTIRRYEKAAPGELVHLDVKKSPRSPQGAAGKLTGAAAPRPAAPAAAAAGTPTCTSPSTTTPGSPTSRPATTRRPPPWPGSGPEPRTGSGPTTCPWTRS